MSVHINTLPPEERRMTFDGYEYQMHRIAERYGDHIDRTLALEWALEDGVVTPVEHLLLLNVTTLVEHDLGRPQ
jgi:hypothetical protein